MTPTNFIHLSLGSNQGDRLEYLQRAIDTLHAVVGEIVAISGVYESPSWGFDGADFYNCCVVVRTHYSTPEVLQKILTIETSLGRIRTIGGAYVGRAIDLDIIFSSEKITATANLIVPHPLMQDRNFVLLPLADIAADVVHPKLKKTVSELLALTSDTSAIAVTDVTLRNPMVHYNFSSIQYLAIEGNIGSGKTTLTKMISQEFNAKLVLERFADNPFLPKFYDAPERYAFPLEMSFLADRYQQLSDAIAQYDLFKDFTISDYHVFKSSIFAKITLSTDEYRLYKRLFDIMYREIVKPDVYIYLYQNTSRLLENIKKRGRTYEQEITSEYLEKIHKGYMRFIKSQPELSVKIVDVTDRDFVNNREDYIWVLDKINPEQHR